MPRVRPEIRPLGRNCKCETLLGHGKNLQSTGLAGCPGASWISLFLAAIMRFRRQSTARRPALDELHATCERFATGRNGAGVGVGIIRVEKIRGLDRVRTEVARVGMR
jgi:hypothetical protein